MKRDSLATRAWCPSLAIAALCVVGSLAVGTPARADVDVRFDVGNAPRAPRLYFHARPHRSYDNTTGVYVIDDPYVGDSDAFQYGGYYWLFSDGYWYRSASYNRGFEVVEPRYVPSAIYDVPANRWHHHPSWDSVHNRGTWSNRTWQDRGTMNTGYRNRDTWRDRSTRTRSDSYYRYRRGDRTDRNRRDNNGYNGDNGDNGYRDRGN